jgi:hypothetical protein
MQLLVVTRDRHAQPRPSNRRLSRTRADDDDDDDDGYILSLEENTIA